MVHLVELRSLSEWAEARLRELVSSAADDEVFQQWNAQRLTEVAVAPTMRDVIDGWRGWIHVAGFGDEFVHEPQNSPPNRYWDPTVTRLWNHHRIAAALIELWMLAGDAVGIAPAEVIAAQPWTAPLATIDEIGGRLALVNTWPLPPVATR